MKLGNREGSGLARSFGARSLGTLAALARCVCIALAAALVGCEPPRGGDAGDVRSSDASAVGDSRAAREAGVGWVCNRGFGGTEWSVTSAVLEVGADACPTVVSVMAYAQTRGGCGPIEPCCDFDPACSFAVRYSYGHQDGAENCPVRAHSRFANCRCQRGTIVCDGATQTCDEASLPRGEVCDSRRITVSPFHSGLCSDCGPLDGGR